MEDLDLTLKLGLPKEDPRKNSSVPMDLNSPSAEDTMYMLQQEGPQDKGAMNNTDVNIMVWNFILEKFSSSGAGSGSHSSESSNSLNPNQSPKTVGIEFVLLDVPPRGDSNGRGGGCYLRSGKNLNELKRCTNYNCYTYDTPMWRRGPLGPKTLCNACGIKYRKEEEKKKAREAARKENGFQLLNGHMFFNFDD